MTTTVLTSCEVSFWQAAPRNLADIVIDNRYRLCLLLTHHLFILFLSLRWQNWAFSIVLQLYILLLPGPFLLFLLPNGAQCLFLLRLAQIVATLLHLLNITLRGLFCLMPIWSLWNSRFYQFFRLSSLFCCLDGRGLSGLFAAVERMAIGLSCCRRLSQVNWTYHCRLIFLVEQITVDMRQILVPIALAPLVSCGSLVVATAFKMLMTVIIERLNHLER